MAINIGSGPNDIPLNSMLGEMAYGENLLEHGYWEPQIAQLGSHTRSSSSGGWWQRCGRMVMVTFSYQWSSRTNDGGYGVKINNLPWKVDMNYGPRINGSVWVSGCEGVLPNLTDHPNRTNIGGYLQDTDVHFRVSCADSNSGGEVSLNGNQSTQQTSGYIYGGAMYVTDGRRNI
jgi:hypothetical protein